MSISGFEVLWLTWLTRARAKGYRVHVSFPMQVWGDLEFAECDRK
jgi:hypothetical protein